LKKDIWCCLGPDKMNKPTLELKFEASFAQQPMKVWPWKEKKFVPRTCDVRQGVVLHLVLYW